MTELKKHDTFSDLPLRPYTIRRHYHPHFHIYKRTKSKRLELLYKKTIKLKEKMKSD